MIPGVGTNSSMSMFPFCLPSCELENGGCAEDEICSLVEQLCPSNGPCPTTVQCSPAGNQLLMELEFIIIRVSPPLTVSDIESVFVPLSRSL